VASYSARGKQYIVELRPFQDGLIMHQLRYSAEVKPWTEVPLPDLPELKPAELGLAKQIIQQIAAETWHPERYKDEVSERMHQLIQQKVEGQEITIAPEAPAGKVIDLMEALKASLGMTKAEERKPAAAAEPKLAAAADAADAEDAEAPAAAAAGEAPKKKTASKKK
jgi:DNA end-binding protein Ku